MTARAVLLALTAVAATAPQPAEGQTWRTLTQARRMTDETDLRVTIEFGAGRLRIVPLDAPTLYRVNLVYDDERFEPGVRYDATRRHLVADIDVREDRRLNLKELDRQSLELGLGRQVPVTLDIRFGAGAADLELGGLALTSASIQTGASESTVRFSAPTTSACRRLTFEVGAAEFRALEVGNARCERVTVNGGVGDLTIDLSGAWPDGQHRVSLSVGLGAVDLRLPRGAGVRLAIKKFIAGVEHTGFTKRGSYYYSEGYDEAAVKLLVEVSATFGSIDVRWTDGQADGPTGGQTDGRTDGR